MGTVIEDRDLRGKTQVFSDRRDAGRRLALFIRDRVTLADPLIYAIPAGGIPVALEVAACLKIPLMLAVVRKLKIPWNPEAGFGAMTWDGQVFLNDRVVQAAGIGPSEIEQAVEETRRNIRDRQARFVTPGRVLSPRDRQVILIDDGLASGFTMRAAISAMRAYSPKEVIVAVPTGSGSAVSLVRDHSDRLICLNLRSGPYFAVADAYRRWWDLSDEEVERLLGQAEDPGFMNRESRFGEKGGN